MIWLLSALACGAPEAGPRNTAVPVITVPVTLGAAEHVVTATGEVGQPEEARLGAEAGGTVTAVPGRVGLRVAAGDLLVELDDRPMRIALQSARARAAQSAATLEARRVSRERVRLRSAGVLAVAAEATNAVSGTEAEIARLDLREADAQVAAAQGDVLATEAAVAAAELEVRRARVTAPFSGVVRDVQALRGQRVALGAALVTLLGDGALEVLVDLPVVEGVTEGQSAEVQGQPAVVRGIVPGLTSARTQRVRLEVSGGVLPGAAAEVKLKLADDPAALSVPRDALVGGAVFAVREGKAVRVPVSVRWESGDLVVVTGALVPGEPVVVRGNEALSDGTAVLGG